MSRFWIVLSITALFCTTPAQGQSICRDGTSSKSLGRGTCSHHGGVAKRADPIAPATGSGAGAILLPSSRQLPTAVRAGERASDNSTSSEQAGQTKVWVHSKSGVYHCPGSRWYGATKSGEYTTERQARAAGDRPAYGRSCS
jgi:hypothetical protein